jgi:hypothetical protein
VSRQSKLRDVSDEQIAVTRIGPALTPLTHERSRAAYENPLNAAAWLRAVHWLRARPGGSRWIMDKGSARPHWSATEEQEKA